VSDQPPSPEARIRTLLDTIEARYGADDYRYKHAASRWVEFFPEEDADVRPHHWDLAEMYLSWALRSPYGFEERQVTFHCNCDRDTGWVCVDREANDWRPCMRCNRTTYDFLLTGSHRAAMETV
jgi:hypothetical protein